VPFRFLDAQVLAVGADDGGDFQFEVEDVLQPRWHRDRVVRSDQRVRVVK